MRKAQAIPEVSGMWVSLVFILVVFMIILGTLAAFPGISDWFSDFFTIPEPTGQDYLIAKQSTEALQCAINSVALGQEWESCWDDFKPGSAGNLGLAGLAAGTTVEDGMVKDGATITCDNKASKCTVRNFQLPQEVSDGENWIPFYGDPNFLMYWNMFPMDEDTWTFQSDWKIHFFIAAVSILPAGKVASIGAKLGLRAVTRRAVKSALKKYLVSFAKKRFLTISGIAKMVAKWALLEAGVAGMSEIDKASAAMTESMMKKYEPQPNSIILKVPAVLSKDDVTPFDLVSELDKNPVLVKWRPEVLTEIKNAHLVSPCQLNEFEVKKTVFVCNMHSYNKETGISLCEGADESDKRLVKCGVFDESVDDYIGTPFYDTAVEAMKSDDRTLYSDTKGTGLWEYPDKMYLPWHSQGGRALYLSDFESNLGAVRNQPPSSGPSTIKYSDIAFDATLYKNGKKAFGLVPVYYEDNTIMESGKTYVLHIYHVSEPWGGLDDVITDIYPADLCDTNADQIIERYEISRKNLTCEQVKKMTETVSSIDDIKDLVVNALEDETEYIRKFTPSSDIAPNDLLATKGVIINFEFGADHLWKDREGSFAGETAEPSYEGCYKDTNIVDGVRVSYSGRRQCFRIMSQPLQVGLTVHKMLFVGADIDEKLLRIESVDEQFKSIFLPDCTRFKAEGSFDEKTLSITEGETLTGCGFSVQRVYIDDENEYTAIFTDDSDNGEWDTVIISPVTALDQDGFLYDWWASKWALIAKEITLSEIDSSGEPQHIGMRNCYIDGVMIDLSNLDNKKMDINGKNYCLRHESTGLVALKWGGRVVGVTGLVLAGIFSGGSAWVFMAIAAIPALAEATTESITEYKGIWPG